MKHVIILAALSAAVLTGCSKNDDNGNAATPAPIIKEGVQGEVSGVWEKGSTYKVTGPLQISAGKSLTIQEGVTVLMSDSVAKPEVIVQGNLYCLGTAANPVKFTVPDAWKTAKNSFGALWGGLIAGAKTTEMVLDNTILEYGGAVVTENSASFKAGLYKAAAGEHVPALYFPNAAGSLIVVNSRVNNFNEDGLYIDGGKLIVANNKFYTTGVSGGDAINIKSGVEADVAFNLIYSPNTNGLKLSNSGDKTPQAHVVAYNNTIVNAGWRRPTIKGGSIWLEVGVKAKLYNNLLANDRFGIKRDPMKTEDLKQSVVSNNLYYGYTAETVTNFQPSTEIVTGTNDVMSKTTGDNDPKFVNYPLNTDMKNATFNTAWDFRLLAGSPALGKGLTTFTRLYAAGLTVGGKLYQSPAPASYIGAYGSN